MKINKKGNITSGTIEKYLYVFIIVVVLLKAIAELLPEAQTAGDELNATGAPLGSFFVSDGIVWLLVMAGLVLLFVKTFMTKK